MNKSLSENCEETCWVIDIEVTLQIAVSQTDYYRISVPTMDTTRPPASYMYLYMTLYNRGWAIYNIVLGFMLGVYLNKWQTYALS